MNLNIKTKYDVGQTLYKASFDVRMGKYVIDTMFVCDIEVRVTAEKGGNTETKIGYACVDRNYDLKLWITDESDVFTSLEEANDWAEKANRE